MAGETKTTTDHEVIRRWVEARGGQPATVKGNEGHEEAGVLRINFPDYDDGEPLRPIPWEEFFQKFEEKELAFLYQDTVRSGEESRFFKFVSREHAQRAAR